MYSILISNLCILCMFTYLGYSLFPLRHESQKINIMIFLLCYIATCFINFHGASSLGLMLLCILHFTYFFIMYKGNLSNCLLALVPFPLIIIISEFFIGNILYIIGMNTSMNAMTFAFANIMSNLLTFIILLVYIKISKLFIKASLPGFTWMIFLLPLSSFILLFKIRDFNLYIMKNDVVLFISIIGIFISNFVVLYIFYKVISAFDDKQKLERSNARERLINQKYELMEQHYHVNFNFLHDLLNECNEIRILIDHEEYNKAANKLESLYNHTYIKFNAIFSNSLILNYLLVDRLEVLNSHNINFKSVIEYNDFQFLSLSEQELLFSMLIDHAIKESENISDTRTLIVKTKKLDFQIIVQVIFSSNCADESEIKLKLDTFLQKHEALYSEYYDLEKHIKSIMIVFLDKTNI